MAIDYNKFPYYDDYDEAKKFLKILFRPGRAVQARELTQLQSILQNQIERQGQHIFKDGSRVFKGEPMYRHQEDQIQYLALDRYGPDGVDIDVSGWVGKKIRNREGTIVATIRNVAPRVGTGVNDTIAEPDTLFITYDIEPTDWDSTKGFGHSTRIYVFDPTGEDQSLVSAQATTLPWGEPGGKDLNGKSIPVTSKNHRIHSGNCAVYDVDEGVYYYKGQFVQSDKQSIVLSKYHNNPTYRVGFKVTEEIITSKDDASLYDPASGFSNFTAPGADRKRINLKLTKVGDGQLLDNTPQHEWFPIAEIEEGHLVWHVEYPQYSAIEAIFARRTYDESGNYTVKPFQPSKRELINKDDPNFIVELAPGTAYVKGHEIRTQRTKKVKFPKARDFNLAPALTETSLYEPGNFVLVYDAGNTNPFGTGDDGVAVNSDHLAENANGLFNVSQGGLAADELLYLHSQKHDLVVKHSTKNANAWNSTLAATARVQGFAYDEAATKRGRRYRGREQGNVYRLYLTDVRPSKVSGKVSQPNILKVTGVSVTAADTALGNPANTTFTIDVSGRHASHADARYWHGFANSNPDPIGEYTTPLLKDDTSTGDTITVNGNADGEYQLRNIPVLVSTSTTITVEGDWSAGSTNPSPPDLWLRRSTGGYSSRRTIMLDANTCSEWNDSYVGSAIKVTKGSEFTDDEKTIRNPDYTSEVRTVIGYCGNNAIAANTQINNGADAKNHFEGNGIIGRPRLLVLDRELSADPDVDHEYVISLGIKQARSVVSDVNEGYTNHFANTIKFGASSINPKTLWNIDIVSGLTGDTVAYDSERTKREPGEAIFNSSETRAFVTMREEGIRSAQTFHTSWRTADHPHGNVSFVTTRTFDFALSSGSYSLLPHEGYYGDNQYWDQTAGSQTKHSEEFLPIGTTTLGGDAGGIASKQYFWTVFNKDTGKTINASSFTVTPQTGDSSASAATQYPRVVIAISDTTQAAADANIRVVAPVQIRNASAKLKSLQLQNSTHFHSHRGHSDIDAHINFPSSSPSTGHTIIRSVEASGVPRNYADYSLAANDHTDTISLGIADAYNVTVWAMMSEGTSLPVNPTRIDSTAKDITNWFDFDNGQKGHIYDHATLTLRQDAEGNLKDLGEVLAIVDYWDSDTLNPSYFSIDSYKHVTDVFHNRTEDTHWAGTLHVNEKVRGANSRVTGYVYDTQRSTPTGDGNYALRLYGVSAFNGNTIFDKGERIEAANDSTRFIQVTSGTTPYVNAEISYSDIPTFVNRTDGSRVSLRDVLDFRPVRKIDDFAANTKYQAGIALTSFESTWNRSFDAELGDFHENSSPLPITAYVLRYLGRIDSLIVTGHGKFTRLKGRPSPRPLPRPRSEETNDSLSQYAEGFMTLAYVNVKPFTKSLDDVDVKLLSRQRYTMEDISRLDNRLKNVEYYVALNALEKNTSDMVITGADGMDRFKNGILVVNFEGTSEVDVYNRDTRGTFCVDPVKQVLLPFQKTLNKIDFKVDESSSSGIRRHGTCNTVLFNYSNTAWIEQPLATTPMPVNPFAARSFSGTIKLTPSDDRWMDMTHNPDPLQIDLTGAQDNFQTPAGYADLPTQAGTAHAVEIGEIKGIYDPSATLELSVDISTHPTYYYDDPWRSRGGWLYKNETGSEGGIAPPGATLESGPQSATLPAGSVQSYSDYRLMMSAVDSSQLIGGAGGTKYAHQSYMRDRDIIIEAKGLKPYSKVYSFFGDLSVSRYVSRANEIYINEPTTKFSVQNGWNADKPTEYETVEIYSPSVSAANLKGRATLLAIRYNEHYVEDPNNATGKPEDKIVQRYPVAYIVPTVNHDPSSGTSHDNMAEDLFYETGGMAGKYLSSSTAILKGKTSGAEVVVDNLAFQRNGHFTGKLQDANTDNRRFGSHATLKNDLGTDRGGWIKLAPDAEIYTSNSFGYYPLTGAGALDTNEMIAGQTQVNIVRGVPQKDSNGRVVKAPGEGTSFMIDRYIDSGAKKGYAYSREIVESDAPTTGSTYTIINKAAAPVANNLYSDYRGLPVGCGNVPYTNRHGEFFGMFHLPFNPEKIMFPYGARTFSISNRGDNNPIYTTSFAHGEYSAEGWTETTRDAVVSTTKYFTKLEKANFHEIANNPLEADGIYPLRTTSDGGEGVFAIVSDVTIPGGSTSCGGTHPWETGSGEFRGDNVWGKIVHKDSQEAKDYNYFGLGTETGTFNFPGVKFTGGDVDGVEGYCITSGGCITDIVITQHGIGSVNQKTGDLIPPTISLTAGDLYHSKALNWITHGKLNAQANVTTDPDLIETVFKGHIQATQDAAMSTVVGAMEGQWQDPLAQSFTIPSTGMAQGGVWLSGIDLFFADKPNTQVSVVGSTKGGGDADLPVRVDIRPMVNNFPDNVILSVGGGSHAWAELTADEVVITDADPYIESPDGTRNQVPDMTKASTWTSFKFDAPAYLMPGKTYCFVVSSASDKYKLWTADSRENLVGTGIDTGAVPIGGHENSILATTSDQVGGTMFKSDIQGAPHSPWKQDPYSDIMFRLRRCKFSNSDATLTLRAGEQMATGNSTIHTFAVRLTDMEPTQTDISYQYRGQDEDGNYGAYDDLVPNSTYETLTEALKLRNDDDFPANEFGTFEVKARLTSEGTDFTSPMIDPTQVKLSYTEHKINNGELKYSQIEKISDGRDNSSTVDDTYEAVGGGGTGGLITVLTDNSGDNGVATYELTNAGSGYHSNPLWVNKTGSPTVNAEFTYMGETSPSGGNADFRYITRRVNLRKGFDARDLKVYVTAHKPIGTNIHVYYKVLAAEDPDTFDQKSWVRLQPQSSGRFDLKPSSPESVDMLPVSEYEYGTPGERIAYEGKYEDSYDTFQTFAIKLVMHSDDSTGNKTPVIRDLRAIALT